MTVTDERQEKKHTAKIEAMILSQSHKDTKKHCTTPLFMKSEIQSNYVQENHAMEKEVNIVIFK